jgi:short-subunit dehydrogenase
VEAIVNINLKPISQQVIVITGASSGIGLATARMAARKGARLVLAARSSEALQQLQEEITQHGGHAIYVESDVGHEGDVERIAAAAEDEFGGFDTWVNNAGASIYGKLSDVPIGDFRKLFETNFWGVVYGSISALRHLRTHGGAIINIGSVASDSAIPLQGTYSATKHAVKGFTDALRMEVEAERLPVSVTLIKPSAINTPYPQHAKSYLSEEPANPSPLYNPEVVAQAILRCAERQCSEVTVGGVGKLMSLAGRYTPRIRDWVFERAVIPAQHSGRATRSDQHRALEHPTNALRERGDQPAFSFNSSLYTQASFHPVMSGLLILGGTVALGALLRGVGNGRLGAYTNGRAQKPYAREQRL